jgi:hypothetical protein
LTLTVPSLRSWLSPPGGAQGAARGPRCGNA